MLRRPFVIVAVSLLALSAACGGEEQQEPRDAGDASSSTLRVPGGPLTPAPGGQIITIDMVTDDQGNNRFIPSEIDASEGDVLHFKLVTGVHNVHFLPDSNPRMRESLPASPLLQLPGQTYDFFVDFEEGRYFFQCDPHALLGMVGYLNVKDR